MCDTDWSLARMWLWRQGTRCLPDAQRAPHTPAHTQPLDSAAAGGRGAAAAAGGAAAGAAMARGAVQRPAQQMRVSSGAVLLLLLLQVLPFLPLWRVIAARILGWAAGRHSSQPKQPRRPPARRRAAAALPQPPPRHEASQARWRGVDSASVWPARAGWQRATGTPTALPADMDPHSRGRRQQQH